MHLVFSLLLLCGEQTATAPQTSDYIVGPQDRLNITVFGEPTLTNIGVDIDSEGVFEFPHIGRVKAAGLTVRQIEQEVTRLLSPPQGFFRNPLVTVQIERYRAQVVWVTGQVRSAGAVPMQGSISVMEAIAKAGSQLPDAGPYVEIYRQPAGVPPTGPATPVPGKTAKPPERVSMADITSGRAQQIMLNPNDTVNVPKAQLAYILDNVRSPGPIVLDGDIDLQKALVLAGGITERGAKGRITILRTENGVQRKFKAKMTDLIKPGDIITVPRKFF